MKKSTFLLTRGHAYNVPAKEKEEYLKTERIILNFLLKRADSLRLSQPIHKTPSFSWRKLLHWKVFGDDNDPRFKETLKLFENEFIRREEVDNTSQSPPTYYFRLSSNLKRYLLKEGLFFTNYIPNYEQGTFYTFEDPTFYTSGRLIGQVITHELMVTLMINQDEQERLRNEGVNFNFCIR